ncbi:MAG: UvrD-helicase domain-containing protein [Myxococcota bacterium]|nr:UvrD-helicase domain-containing protein [Myxococcota bacterium]
MLADSITDGLNAEQLRAVETTEGPLLVLAGAGSGKTRVLTSRIAYLIGVCGIPGSGLLAVTFTNKAAGEMKERVEKLLGPEANDLAIGTFHSICVRILRRDIGHLGRSRGFVIYDDSDSVGVIKQALKREGLDPKAHDPKRIRWRIDQWKNAGILPAQAAQEAFDIDDELSARFYGVYQRMLADANALDFGDLLLQTVELFKQFPRVLEYYQRRWQYVLVDEFQDTNGIQLSLVNLLAANHRNLCVVGDPDQSIYAWRGANVRNILDFEESYSEAAVIKLERNYRSTQPILAGASAVVSNNIERKEKQLFTEQEGGDLIQFFEADDDREEASWVIRKIATAASQDARAFSNFAILYRTNAQSRAFEEELLKYNIPYAVVGGVRFYDRAEVKDAMAYLRLLINPQDDQALLRIVNKPARGIGKTTVDRVGVLAANRETCLGEALVEFGREATARVKGKIQAFVGLLDELRAEMASRPLDQLIAKLLERSGYMEALAKEGTPEAEARRDNLLELMASARDFHAANEGALDEGRSELELFLEQVALISDLDTWEDRTEKVSLMTVHSSKGLEFPAVFLVGMEERIFPHASSAGDAEGIEEERRLCYVAMTRAMEQLHITHAAERRRFGERNFQTPSRFLDEIPSDVVEVLSHGRAAGKKKQSRSSRGGESNFDYSYSQETSGGEGDIQLGMRVRHPVFGEGEIMEMIGGGVNQKLKIRFARVGVKTVMLRFANLELA